jgi:hypothetical protein
VREGSRVRKEYLGAAPWVEAAARLEEMDRGRREWDRIEQQAEQERLEAAHAPLAELCELTDLAEVKQGAGAG